VALNSLPAAFMVDYRGLHYLTAPNMVQLDAGNKSPGIFNSGTMFSYDPGEVYRCCQHNHAFGWPYYTEHLWMATLDRGVAAVLLGECVVTVKVADGREVRISERTAYPFDESVKIEVSTEQPVSFPLYIRVPAWATGVQTVLNGGGTTATQDLGAESAGKFLRVEREWRDGDSVEVRFGASVQTKTWDENKGAVSVRRGPLWYSLKIDERYEPLSKGPWPGIEVYPSTAWNYGLLLSGNDQEDFRFERGKASAAQPWTADAAPVRLHARGRRIPLWKTDKNGMVQALQQSPIRSGEPVESLELIPMGAARLRISAFPVVSEDAAAREWVEPPPPRHEASYEFDDINALSDGKSPRSSGDQSIPRFTWWNHKGTTEWVTYKLGGMRAVSSCEVYWFDDTGRGACRVPAEWTLAYKKDGAWVPVANASGFGMDKDRFNTVKFDEVMTDELRMDVKLRPEFSGGILEWRVPGAG
jgi:hypothetical protein